LPEVVCNTSPLQYLHQLGQLELLSSLAKRVIVPDAVVGELAAGTAQGLDLPDPNQLEWCIIRTPRNTSVLPLMNELGAGEIAMLALALEMDDDVVVVLDDAQARFFAEKLEIPLTGTIGLLLDAKRAGLIEAVCPLLDDLHRLRFRLSKSIRQMALELAGELSR
jgi:predicted nucleic acid-binding protein